MNALRPCLDCSALTRDPSSRCDPCRSEWNRKRNARRTQYQGTWKQESKRRRQGARCARCGTTLDLTLDHETNTVECRRCNASHRRNPS